MSWEIEITNTNPQVDDLVTVELNCVGEFTLLLVKSYVKDDEGLPSKIKTSMDSKSEVVMVLFLMEGGVNSSVSHVVSESNSDLNIENTTVRPSNFEIIAYELANSEIKHQQKPIKGQVSNPKILPKKL